jgi:ankyrin repeat protein
METFQNNEENNFNEDNIIIINKIKSLDKEKEKEKDIKFVGNVNTDPDNINIEINEIKNKNQDIENLNFDILYKELNFEKIKFFFERKEKDYKKSEIINKQEKLTKSTLLLKSIMHNNNLLTEYLLNLKANPNICNKNKESPLHFAVENSNYKIINSLLENGANPNLQNQVINYIILYFII